MGRIKFIKTSQRKFFKHIQEITKLNSRELAEVCKSNRRTLSDWKNGKSLMPDFIFNKLIEISDTDPPSTEILPEYWYTHIGSGKGAKATYKKYGTFFPGWTKEASVRGGLKAIESHRLKGSKFFVPKPISVPKHSNNLAEFVGIVLGDGGLTSKQVEITLDNHSDQDYAIFIQQLIKGLFNVVPAVGMRKDKRAIRIVVSRKKLISFLVEMGLCVGDKVAKQVAVPGWIKGSSQFSKPCLRGLFDTDGCFYIDKHRYRNRLYHNSAMNFTNRSMPILSFFRDTLVNDLNLHPTHNTKFSMCLRRESEIISYFQKVGTSNSKHFNKFSNYYKNKYGEVPKFGYNGTVSKTDGLD